MVCPGEGPPPPPEITIGRSRPAPEKIPDIPPPLEPEEVVTAPAPPPPYVAAPPRAPPSPVTIVKVSLTFFTVIKTFE